MTRLLSIFDVLLAAGLLGLAWTAMASRDLFKAVVLFIVFGLLLSLAWVRLGAVDIALAEAAIGAGLTGVLLLNMTGFLRRRKHGPQENALRTTKDGDTHGAWSARRSLAARFLTAFLCIAAGISTALIVADLAGQEGRGLFAQVQALIAMSGVASPVTAVLLNFRGYDTLLEIGVLLLAVTGLSSLRQRNVSLIPHESRDNPVLSALARLLFPLAVLTAGYFLWSGTHAPGGAFQAGAALGAGGVLLHLAGFTAPAGLRGGLLRGLFLFGFCVFLAVAAGVMLAGNLFLQYPPDRAGELIVLIESALTVSIAFILAGLVLISSPPPQHDHASPPAGRDTP